MTTGMGVSQNEIRHEYAYKYEHDFVCEHRYEHVYVYGCEHECANEQACGRE